MPLALFALLPFPLIPPVSSAAVDETEIKPQSPSFFSSVTGGRVGSTPDAFRASLCLEQGDDLEVHFTAAQVSWMRPASSAGGGSVSVADRRHKGVS